MVVRVFPARLLVLLLLAVLLAQGSVSAGPIPYNVFDLGTLGGPSSFAYGINNSGNATGSAYTAVGVDVHTFFYENGKMRDLGSLGPQVDGGFSAGNMINDSDQIVGVTLDSSGSPTAFVWDFSHGMKSLNIPNSYGIGISNNGLVIGNTNNQVFVWNPQTGAQLIPLLPGCTVGNAEGINNAGVAVGYCTAPHGQPQAFAWDSVHGTRPLAPGMFDSIARSVDNNGNIFGGVGFGLAGPGRAVEWDSLGMEFLPLIPDGVGGVLTTDAYDSNALGTVIGLAALSSGTQVGAAVWLRSSGTFNGYLLDDLLYGNSGWHITQANGINDAGQIVGYGSKNGITHALLLDPVPEVSSGLSLFGGLTALLVFRLKGAYRWQP